MYSTSPGATNLSNSYSSMEKRNSKQHMALFIKTCNNAGTDDNLMVKQFVETPKAIAFNWYTNFEPESINN